MSDAHLADHRRRTLWLTSVLHAFTHLYQVMLMPLYLLMQQDLKLPSLGQATLMMTVMMVACFGPSYPMGILADKLNRKKLLGFGLALNGLGCVALALAPGYGSALLAVTIAGVGGSFYHPAATAMITRLFPQNTGRALGLVGSGASVGFFLGPLYAGWRAASLEPLLGPAAWRRPVLELGVLGLLAAVVFLWLADEEHPAPVTVANDPRPQSLFPNPTVWMFFFAFCLAFSLRDFAGASMGSLGSLFLQKAHGFGPKLTGIALSGMYLAGAVSNPLFGGLSDRGRKRWIAFVLIISAVLVAAFPHVPAGLTIPLLLAYGFFLMASYPMTEAALMESVPDGVRGRVFGLFIMAAGVIGNLSHWIAGAQVKRLGERATSVSTYYPIYLGLAVLMLGALGGLLCLNPIRKREPLPPKPANPESMPLLT